MMSVAQIPALAAPRMVFRVAGRPLRSEGVLGRWNCRSRCRTETSDRLDLAKPARLLAASRDQLACRVSRTGRGNAGLVRPMQVQYISTPGTGQLLPDLMTIPIVPAGSLQTRNRKDLGRWPPTEYRARSTSPVAISAPGAAISRTACVRRGAKIARQGRMPRRTARTRPDLSSMIRSRGNRSKQVWTEEHGTRSNPRPSSGARRSCQPISRDQ
jgi:hypothetical protein